MVFSKILQESSVDAKDNVDIFKNEFIGDAINLSLKFLSINQKRSTSDEEEEAEKTVLSLAIVNFLKHVSRDKILCKKLFEIGEEKNSLN